jgi:hypothetical protein
MAPALRSPCLMGSLECVGWSPEPLVVSVRCHFVATRSAVVMGLVLKVSSVGFVDL